MSRVAAVDLGTNSTRLLVAEPAAGNGPVGPLATVERHMAAPLPMIGGGQPVAEAVTLLEKSDAAIVLVDGKPRGVLTRQDLLSFLT